MYSELIVSIVGSVEVNGDVDIPPMLPASYGSPLDTSPVLPEMGSSDCGPQITLVAAWVMLFMVSMSVMLIGFKVSSCCFCAVNEHQQIIVGKAEGYQLFRLQVD